MTIDMAVARKLFNLAGESVGSYANSVGEFGGVVHRVAVHFYTREDAKLFQSLIAGIAAPAVAKPALETVDEHNARKRIEREQAEEAAKRTGVACPKCGKELRRQVDNALLTCSVSMSTRVSRAICVECKLTVELED